MRLGLSSAALLFLFTALPFSIRAEYRVFQFAVKAKSPFSLDQRSHIVTSTLNPQSYIAYHGGGDTLTIDLMRTWMCRGNTSQQKTCKPPALAKKEDLEVN